MGVAFCSLCGVSLTTSATNAWDNLPSGELTWSAEVRAVKSVEDTSSPFITGLGYLCDDLTLVVHPDETIRYSDDIERLEEVQLLNWSRVYWAFVFHDVCWSLLLRRIAKEEYDSAQVAKHLFQILYCTPWNTRSYIPYGDHDYGGASKFHHHAVEIQSLSRTDLPTWSFLTSDPRVDDQIDLLDASLFGIANPIVSRSGQDNSTDVFRLLPDEVVVLILNMLTSTDIGNLRRSSKSVAGFSSPYHFPQSFWASRFEKHHEMGFALSCKSPSDFDTHTDWRRLYIAFKNSLQNLDGGWGIKNRKRIWDVLSNISRPLDDLLSHEPIHQGENLENVQLSWRCIKSPNISAEVTLEHKARDVFHLGTRRLGVDHFRWPSSGGEGKIIIGVSFIWFSGQSYVCGLRIWRSDRPLGSQQLGLVIPSTEEVLRFDANHHLEGLEIALTRNGIVGLRFLIKSVSGDFSCTAGDFAATEKCVGVTRLLRHRESQVLDIQIGFDACKLISIQFYGRICSDATGDTVSTNVTSSLWKAQNTKDPPTGFGQSVAMEIPTHVDSMQPLSTISDNRAFQLRLNMNFAGPGGHRLSSLRRIVALVNSDRICPFLGFKFIYDDGDGGRVYDSRIMHHHLENAKFVESSFSIDGAAGERVSAVRVLVAKSFFGIARIEIYTNRGNSTSFGVRPAFLGDSMYSLSTLEPPSGGVITGFVATLSVRTFDEYFNTFGIHSQAIEEMNLPNEHDPPLLSSPESIPELTTCLKVLSAAGALSLKSAATLSNIRRIRISCGKEEFGLSHTISGLWIEYYSTRRPSFVGQWVREAAASELAPGEELTEISIWIVKDPIDAWRIVALRFDTSVGKSLRFGNEDYACAFYLKFTANVYEKLDSIFWAFGSKLDYVRVTCSPQLGQQHRALSLLGHESNARLPSAKFFKTIKDSNGNNSLLVAIHVWSYLPNGIAGLPFSIAGLSFTYACGDAHMIGRREGTPSVLRLEPGEELTRLETVINSHGKWPTLISVSLDTNYQQTRTFPSKTGGCLPLADPSHVYSLHPSSHVAPAANSCMLHQFPYDAEDFVGFWVTARDERCLTGMGPMYIHTRRGD